MQVVDSFEEQLLDCIVLQRSKIPFRLIIWFRNIPPNDIISHLNRNRFVVRWGFWQIQHKPSNQFPGKPPAHTVFILFGKSRLPNCLIYMSSKEVGKWNFVSQNQNKSCLGIPQSSNRGLWLHLPKVNWLHRLNWPRSTASSQHAHKRRGATLAQCHDDSKTLWCILPGSCECSSTD